MKPLTLVLWAVSLSAQNVIPDAVPTFQTGPRLVQVDAIVQDKKGAVKGLTRNDFTILDNGVPQTIAIFSVREIKNTVQSQPLPAGVVTNRPLTQGGEPVAGTIIFFDRLNTPVEDQGYARVQALKYLDRAQRNEQIAVYSLNKTLTVLQGFTSDRELLIQAVRRSFPELSTDLATDNLVEGVPPTNRNAASEASANGRQRRQDITAAALATLARHLSGLPGRKKLVWITASLPMYFVEQREYNGMPITEYQTYSAQIDKSIRALNDSNIGVYPVDPRGVAAGLTDPNITAMNALADMTGGQAHYADNDIASLIEKVMTDTDLTYTLGFYPSEDKLDGKFHAITVRVDRLDVQIRNRRGYSASLPARPLTDALRHRTLDAWVQEPLDATDLSVSAKAKIMPGRPGYYSVEVSIDPAELQLGEKNGHRVGSIDLAVVPDVNRKTKGLQQTIKINMTQDGYAQALTKGIRVANSIKVTDAKGKLLAKNLHLVVMDGTSGKAGSVRIPIREK